MTFDYRESTITFNYTSKTVEFYFTKKTNYDNCLKRNPMCVCHKDLNPGYIIVYPMSECRLPELLLKTSRVVDASAFVERTQKTSI